METMGQGSFFIFFAHGYPIVLAALVKKIIFNLFNYLGSFVENQLNIQSLGICEGDWFQDPL